MSAIIIPFETQAQREDRLFREAMTAFDAYGAAHTQAELDALVRTLDRLAAALGTPRRPADRAPPEPVGLTAC